ncbi:MAG TPA: hypothetical protein V6D00_05170 [Pantanalinema sp.]
MTDDGVGDGQREENEAGKRKIYEKSRLIDDVVVRQIWNDPENRPRQIRKSSAKQGDLDLLPLTNALATNQTEENTSDQAKHSEQDPHEGHILQPHVEIEALWIFEMANRPKNELPESEQQQRRRVGQQIQPGAPLEPMGRVREYHSKV